jgi:hypothetical protein
MIRSLVACDAEFARSVPEQVCAEAGRGRASVYARFVPFAWIGLDLRSRLLDAYGIPRNPSDDRQLILLTFVHREWDDLLDAYQPEVLYHVLRSPDTPEPRLRLLHHVTGLSNALAREKGLFEKMLEVWDTAMAFYNRPFKPEEAASYLEKKAAINEDLYARTLVPEIPPGLARSLGPFYTWFLGLDDAADVRRDAARGRVTYMTLAADPIGEIRKLLRACEDALRASATRDPRPLMLLMRSMTAEVTAALGEGRDIERDLFAGPAAPVNRNPSPSNPYRAGPS